VHRSGFRTCLSVTGHLRRFNRAAATSAMLTSTGGHIAARLSLAIASIKSGSGPFDSALNLQGRAALASQ
jgi:hypothetical protein